MKIYIFNNAVPTQYGMSGSDRRALEYSRFFVKKGFPVALILPKVALKRYEGIAAEFLITDNKENESKLSPWFLLRRIQMAENICKGLKLEFHDIIYSSSDILADSIPALGLKKQNNNARLICGLHLMAPLPWKGARYAFTKGWKLPGLKDIYYYLSQNYILRQLRKYADLVLVSNYFDEGALISKGFKTDQVLVCYGAPEHEIIEAVPAPPAGEKKFDAVFVGRNHEQKGLIDLIKATNIISRKKNDFKLALISDIPQEVLSLLINKYDAGKNILFFGFKSGNEKFKIMKQSKLSVCPSYYESFGMVVVEAMACSLPVVAYDLPIYKKIYPAGMISVEIGNTNELSKSILNLLSDESARQRLANEAYALSKQFSWEKTAETILERLT